MNNRQKIVQEQFLNNEEAIIKRLKQVYNKSLADIEEKTKALQDDINRLGALADLAEDDEEKAKILSMQQSKVYQKQYQDAMKKQIGSVLDQMQVEEFKTVSDYLNKCYEEGFVGTMYDLQGQGIPLCFPMDQEAIVRAVQIDSKISQGLYSRLGEDVSMLKKKITAEVARGISTGVSYQQIAQQLAGVSKIGFNNAVRIARTEGHRIATQSAMDACHKAKDHGADIVKQWDATLDSSTRESHSQVDMEIRELDKPFSNGLMFPGDPRGGAAEVVNCRCSLDQRARWELEGEFTKWDGFTGELKTFESQEAYDEYKKAYFSKENKQYMKYVEEMQGKYNSGNFEKVMTKMTDAEYKHFTKLQAARPTFEGMYRNQPYVKKINATKYDDFKAEYTEKAKEAENALRYIESEKIAKSIDFAVDSTMLESREFADKFSIMTTDKDERREFLKSAKEMLHHRSGQNGEDLYLYNKTKRKWYKSTTGIEAETPEYTEEILSAIRNSANGDLISFHNHPSNMPPSVDDLNAALQNGYSVGYTICHNGKIFRYTPPTHYIDTAIYDLRIDKYKKEGYNEFGAQQAAIEYLADVYGFEFKEVK